jgi:hypothetical protein
VLVQRYEKNIEIERVCYYPEKVREMILERYYDGNEIEMNMREEIKNLLKEYSFKSKKKLREMVKISWIDV